MRQVLVIACGGSKHQTPNGAVRALDLYAGRQFGVARAMEAAGWDVLILSAKHGLVTADTRLEWYDHRMTADLSRRVVDRITADPRRSLAAHTFHAWTHDAARVVFYGGEDYWRVFDALVGATDLARVSRRCDVVQIVGAGCGDHFSVLKEIAAESGATMED